MFFVTFALCTHVILIASISLSSMDGIIAISVSVVWRSGLFVRRLCGLFSELIEYCFSAGIYCSDDLEFQK